MKAWGRKAVGFRYDDHREAILRSGRGHQAGDSHTSDTHFEGFSVEELYTYFSVSRFSGYHTGPNGFYTVYRDVFEKVVKNEVDFGARYGGEVASFPSFGSDTSSSAEVSSFYHFWTNFVTRMDFAFVDQHNPSSAPNRRVRRAMEDENQKARKAAKREYIEAVRQLAAFVKKRDVRVLKMQKEEAERKAQRRAEEEKRKQLEAEERRRKASEYEDADWIQNSEAVDNDDVEATSEASVQEALWCVICDKVFKSEKAMQNHEKYVTALAFPPAQRAMSASRSKKHREKLAAIEKALKEEQEQEVEGPLETTEPSPKRKDVSVPRPEEQSCVVVDGIDDSDQASDDIDDDTFLERFVALRVDDRRKDEPSVDGSIDDEATVADAVSGQAATAKRSAKKKKRRAKKAEPVTTEPLTCETCGETFGSRNRLFQHLSQTKHASLKATNG